jgi:hypothetical protein
MTIKKDSLGFRIITVGLLSVGAALSEKSGVSPIVIVACIAILICAGLSARLFLRFRQERRREPQIAPTAKSKSTAAGL